MRTLGWGVVATCCALVACGSRGGPAASGGGGGNQGGNEGGNEESRGIARPSLATGDFTFYGNDGGMPPEVWDASPDEAGNVYVAAGTHVLAKKRGDESFLKFDAASAGITRNCDADKTKACPMVSVGGGAPGTVVVGLQGLGTDNDNDPSWWLDSGGADVLAFDGENLSRRRHVQVSGVPHQFCQGYLPGPCPGDTIWDDGRRKVRQVLRIAVDHRVGAPQYGDVWMAGSHGTFNVLIANAESRGWVDLTASFPGTEDRKDVWEHDHPAMTIWATINGVKQIAFLSGNSTALALDPTTGDPWAANETRLASKRGAGARPDGWNAAMWPPWVPDEIGSYLDVWPDPRPADPTDFDAMDPGWMDATASLSFCDDGTLWIASWLHGLARRAPTGEISYVDLPPGLGNSAFAVACDPRDGSVWVGFGWGGFGRWNGSSWWTVEQVSSAPAFAITAPVRSIQIDRWTSPRIIYITHMASRVGPGGLTVYDGP